MFIHSSALLCEEIKRITGVEVVESSAEVAAVTGSAVQVFTNGTMVQVFLLAHEVAAECWSGNRSASQS